MVGKRGKILDLRMLVDTRQSTRKTSSVCKIRVNIYLLPLIRTYLERLLYRSNSILLLRSLGGAISTMTLILSGLASIPF